MKPKQQDRIQQKQLMINRARMSLNADSSGTVVPKARHDDLANFGNKPIDSSEVSSNSSLKIPFNTSPYLTNEKQGPQRQAKIDSEPRKARIPDRENVEPIDILLMNDEIMTP